MTSLQNKSFVVSSLWLKQRSSIWQIAIFVALILAPLAARLGSESYVLSLLTRVVVLAIAAIALDLLIGYAGLVSLGHAAFLGIGTYSAGILAANGQPEGVVAFLVAMVIGGTFALITGAIALRSRGAYFIMITLAFGQMLYFVATALAQYGGDDGMTLPERSRLLGTQLLDSDWGLYYVSLAVLGLSYGVLRQIIGSRFGRVLAGARENEVRVQAIGFKPYQFRLIAYVIAGIFTSIAGVLLANQAGFVSPSIMSWQRSGDLIFMVALGGCGRLYGAIVGTIAYVLAEELLSNWWEHWQLIFGPLLIATIFLARRGIVGIADREEGVQ